MTRSCATSSSCVDSTIAKETIVQTADRLTAGRQAAVALFAGALAALALAVGALAPAANAATGDLFGFAEQTDPDTGTSAPAFPAGPDAHTWWAGVCDLRSGSFAVGADPGTRFPNCIDHPPSFPFGSGNEGSTQLQPPLSPYAVDEPGDAGSDGWRRQSSGQLGGPSWRLADVTRAGAHPDGTASFWFSRDRHFKTANIPSTSYGPDGAPRTVRVSLPPGAIGDPNAVPKCPAEALRFTPTTCSPKSQVGVSTISLGGFTAVFPVYNVEPRDGKTAELIISGAGIDVIYQTNAPIVANARTTGDFGVDAVASEIPSATVIHSQTFTIWGVPWAASHDAYRPATAYCHELALVDPFGTNAWKTPGMPVEGLAGGSVDGCSQDPVSYDPSWGPIRPFLSLPTDCAAPDAERNTHVRADNYHTSVVAEEDSVAPQLEGCEDVEFDTKADFSVAATSTSADGASGLDVELTVDQNTVAPLAKRFNADDNDPDSAIAHWKSTAGLATSHLDQTLLTLPAGVAVNPSGATGLGGCSDAQIGLTAQGSPPRFNDGDPFDGDASDGAECPQSSVIGKVHEVKTHLLDETLSGEIVLGQPKPEDIGAADEPLRVRLFLVVRNRERGLVAKIFGTTVIDPMTGQIKANFDDNPRVPFERLSLSIKGGERGMLALPQRCTSRDWSSELVPWSGGESAVDDGAFVTNENCANAFAPTLAAGMSTPAARSNGTFSFEFARPEGNQFLRGLTAKLPQGLLASVKGLPLCTRAQADAAACPAASKIGIADAKAGSGDPFVLERKGEVFLTEGYRGGEYGLAVKIRPIAGPFRGAAELRPIVVRQAVHVDRKTAQVTAISDPFPLIHHGVPLRVREVTVLVDRDRFMLNPSDCAQKHVGATLASDQGTSSALSNRFQTTGCADLPFRPKLALRLTGRKQIKTGRHPGVKAEVTQRGIGEAGIEKAVVRLPKSLALDPDNAQALCEFEAGTKEDLEKHCPKGSIVGRARATSPLLNDPLVGNVYFVKNIRTDAKTGNQIRTLPMIVVALRGEIAINLEGESSTTKDGKLVNTFDNVPDAPVSKFNLNINGGRNGILAVTRTRKARINLCAKPKSHVAEADTDGQNGKRHDLDVRMKAPCTKRQIRAAKRQAKRTAAARRSASRRR
jgi:hypothetical protein